MLLAHDEGREDVMMLSFTPTVQPCVGGGPSSIHRSVHWFASIYEWFLTATEFWVCPLTLTCTCSPGQEVICPRDRKLCGPDLPLRMQPKFGAVSVRIDLSRQETKFSGVLEPSDARHQPAKGPSTMSIMERLADVQIEIVAGDVTVRVEVGEVFGCSEGKPLHLCYQQ
jgi:hypothetical protein